MFIIQHYSIILWTFFLFSFLCGGLNLIFGILFSTIPIGIVFVGLITCLIYVFRIAAPNCKDVEAVLGKDLHLDHAPDEYIMRSVAHRGAGLDAPENTLEAFKMCKANACTAIEFDVALTSDDLVVVFHDETLERMTDLDHVINNSSYSVLRNLDLSVKHPLKDRYKGSYIPLLDDAIQTILKSDQRMFIDIKDNNMKFVSIIQLLFQKHQMLYSRAVVTSFYPNIIYMIRKGDPKIVCSLSWRPHVFAYCSYNYPDGLGERRSKIWYKHWFLCLCDMLHSWCLPRFTYYLLGLSAVLLHKDAINGCEILKWRSKGVRVIAWTANTLIEKRFFAKTLKITYLTDTLTGETSVHTIDQDF